MIFHRSRCFLAPCSRCRQVALRPTSQRCHTRLAARLSPHPWQLLFKDMRVWFMDNNHDICRRAAAAARTIFRGGVYSVELPSGTPRQSARIDSPCSVVWFWDTQSLRTTRLRSQLCFIPNRRSVAPADAAGADAPTVKTRTRPRMSQGRKSNTFVTSLAVGRFTARRHISKRTCAGTRVSGRSCVTGYSVGRVSRAPTSCRDTCARTRVRSASPARTVASASCAATTSPST